jgi:type I restriction enzyme S subunit
MIKAENLVQTGIAWIPEIPADWELKRIKLLFDFNKNIVGKTSADFDVLSLTTKGVIKRDLESGMGKFPASFDGYQIVKPNSIMLCLFDMDVTPRVVGHVEDEGIISAAYTNIIPKKGINSKYYYYYFLLQDKNKSLLALGTGIRITLNKDFFGTLKIPVPPLSVQNSIVAYLDKKNNEIDKFIRNKERLIELLEERKSTIINEAICGRLGYNNKNDKKIVSYIIGNESEFENSKFEWIGRTPRRWQYKKLSWVSKFQEGPGLRTWQFTNDGVKVICVTNITEEGIDFSLLTRCISEKEYKKKYKHFTINKGDYLLASSGASWGKVAEYTADENVILNTSTIRFNSINHQLYSKKFIKWAMKSRYMSEHLNLLLTGSCQPNFGPSHLQKLILNIPTIEEQISIVEFIESELSEIHKSIKIINQEISSIKEYREALITDLVTGKRSVPQSQMS